MSGVASICPLPDASVGIAALITAIMACLHGTAAMLSAPPVLMLSQTHEATDGQIDLSLSPEYQTCMLLLQNMI